MEYEIADIALQLPEELIPPRFAEALHPFARDRHGDGAAQDTASETGIRLGPDCAGLILEAAPGIRRAAQWHELHRFDFADADADCRFGRDAAGWLLEMSPRRKEAIVRFRYPTEGQPARCDFRRGLHPGLFRFGVWTLFNLAALARSTVAIHASSIVYRERGLLFLGESGTGKSTHTQLWQEHIPGATLLNDDSPVIGCRGAEIRVWGSPWSGKRPCYRHESYPVGGFIRLVQGPENRIRRLSPVEALGALFPSTPPAFVRDACLRDSVCSLLATAITQIPVYRLECRPDADAARLVRQTLFGEGTPSGQSPAAPYPAEPTARPR